MKNKLITKGISLIKKKALIILMLFENTRVYRERELEH